MADDPWARFNPEKPPSDDEWAKFNPPSSPDPGWMPAIGRTARGMATGVESTVDYMGAGLPGFLGPHDPELARKTREGIPEPKDAFESFGHGLGEMIPTLAVPELGADAAAIRALRFARGLRGPQLTQFARQKGFTSALERLAGGATEGGARGAIGGTMVPDEETGTDAAIGGGAGAAVRGMGDIAQSSVMALPPKVKNTIGAVAAMATANKLGMPWWVAFMHPGAWQEGSVFQQLYNTNLLDLASKYLRSATRRPNPAFVGASGVKLKQEIEDN